MRRLAIGLVVVIAGWACQGILHAETKARGYIGINYDTVKDLPETASAPCGAGLRVTRVMANSPAERAALKMGDIILTIDGAYLCDGGRDPSDALKAIMAETTVGQTIGLTLLRQPLELSIAVNDQLLTDPDAQQAFIGALPHKLDELAADGKYEISARRFGAIVAVSVLLGENPAEALAAGVPTNDLIRPELASWQPELQQVAERLVREAGDQAAYDDVRQRLQDIERGEDGYRLRLVRYLHRSPFAMERLTYEVLNKLRASPTDDAALAKLTANAAACLDLQPMLLHPSRLRWNLSPEQHLDQLEALLWFTSTLVYLAFTDFTTAERTFLEENLIGVGDAFTESIYLQADENRQRYEKNLRIVELAKKIHWNALFAAAISLERLHDGEYLEELKQDFKALDTPGKTEFLAQRRTSFGLIVIGGSERNVYRDFDAAIIIDLGGDDIYHNNAGGAHGFGMPVAAVIDLGGNDAYETTANGAQGAALIGVGLLYDMHGNDSYIGQRWCQGAAMCGIGVLDDEAGNDRYRAQEQAQGIGLWGAGMLLDFTGDDRYSANLQAQGVGLPRGLGLCADYRGNDEYYAKGKYPTNYGTPGVFDAWSQGCGIGFRELASGGIGVLTDQEGDDLYEGGNFSQGGGYYYGWGIQRDSGGNDRYIGSRYNQGFSAHQALGTFLDEEGDDFYTTRQAVAPGLAWDQCVTLFIDRSGNDVYQSGGFSLGAAAHNAITIFIDGRGSDRYSGVQPALVTGNDYHGGYSLALFFDLGKARDIYPEGFRNYGIAHRAGQGFFVDFKGKELHELLTEPLKPLLFAWPEK